MSVPESDSVFFSRLYRRHKLDEKGGTGALTHTVCLPRKALLEGSSYSNVEAAMVEFEAKNGVPVGDIQKLDVRWDGDGSGKVNAKGKPLLKRDVPARLAENYRKDASVRFVMTCRGTQLVERMSLGYSLSRIPDLEIGLVPVSFLTESRLSLGNSYFNLVLANMPLFVPPRIGSRTIESQGSRVRREAPPTPTR